MTNTITVKNIEEMNEIMTELDKTTVRNETGLTLIGTFKIEDNDSEPVKDPYKCKNSKQERIEMVIAKHGTKGYSTKQMANFAKVSAKTFRTRCSKLTKKGLIYGVHLGKVSAFMCNNTLYV